MIVQRTKTYAVCPSCGQDAGSVDHLLNLKTSTSWYCDSCGEKYALTFHGGGRVDIAKDKGRKVTTLDLLVLRPQDKPVYFIVEGMRFEDEPSVIDKIHYNAAKLRGESVTLEISERTDTEEHGHKQFYYESHSCPTNWLKPEMVYFDGDSDPHGVIEFVAYVDSASLPPDENFGPNAHDDALVAFIERNLAADTPRETPK